MYRGTYSSGTKADILPQDISILTVFPPFLCIFPNFRNMIALALVSKGFFS